MRASLSIACCVLAGWAWPAQADTASPRLAKYKEPVDRCIEKALARLAKLQVTAANRWKNPALAGSFGFRLIGSTGVTSLSVMAFLSKGYTPGSGPYGEAINKGIDYILTTQQKDGLLASAARYGRSHGPMYSHCIATLMLSEVSGMVTPERQKKIDEVLPRALAVIVAAQQVKKHPKYQGGWRYRPNSRDSDISLTGWALMALRSARLNGAPIPAKLIAQAGEFILRCRRNDGGFGYMPGSGSGVARAGVALLCLELTGHHGKDYTLKAGDYLLKPIKQGKFIRDPHPFYAAYYASQGMFQLGGDYWELFAEAMYKDMMKKQRADGSWSGGKGGVAYSTAMSVLALTVSYRQLPIYQR